jgi:cytidylate kinase
MLRAVVGFQPATHLLYQRLGTYSSCSSLLRCIVQSPLPACQPPDGLAARLKPRDWARLANRGSAMLQYPTGTHAAPGSGMLKPLIMTIDGPAASGKSTLGALLAKQLGYTYFDTGVLYRALTYLALKRHVDLDSAAQLAELAAGMQATVEPPTVDDGRQYTVLVDGEDITWALRQPDVERNVSTVSAYPEVRTALREQQRIIGRRGRVVMVGRDIGSVVMPSADLKIYLRASAEERARRRHDEMARQGRDIAYATVYDDLRQRDDRDAQNTYQPDDAVVIDSDGLTPEQIVGRILALVERRS